MNIHGYAPLSSIGQATKAADPGKAAAGNGGNFAALLNSYTQQVNNDTKVANSAAQDLALGKGGSTSEALLAIQKADLSFQMMMGVRNKLVDAYREISRMQV
ncbi:MAG: flagellar hook-basal body complex protein FliE [Zetaproteobacteria bacterium CG12_big_fil_rev_8_21_14_0_65_54_13]|nr:MAG: flagellar hook-basal body complex protein FliE [Zetaproteobacteria bacterium CG23_combo_of_CG06-09_8_20_14_all_54_7]PIW51228.1 MAG: flagellar hook-basal body complex protein FliE [Zetaproteobacteria bacterium CG12_big_fil_rev_8_21_14_0_65_54_13]PIX53526.1 MAG: flagellar hook-basal body complex protein FliE [Zetaproteobacteria bacterium CG_4_10_14_3_um_filter_54_28]PJA28336.1 MAG: flagellar hook-basal body complex protein FliE [Zetaproteobacteria bacterium CG_4_9_14_3_um_filter_54_145]